MLSRDSTPLDYVAYTTFVPKYSAYIIFFVKVNTVSRLYSLVKVYEAFDFKEKSMCAAFLKGGTNIHLQVATIHHFFKKEAQQYEEKNTLF